VGIRHILGSLILLVCVCRDSHGQLTKSSGSKNAQSDRIDILQALVALNPTNIQGLLELGYTYYGEENYTSAVGPFEKVVFIEPTNYEANLYLGYTHYYLDQFAAAAVAFQAATKSRSADAEAQYWLGATLYCLKRYDDSITVLKRTLVADPNRADAWFVLGSCQYYQKAFQVAAESFQQAALHEPTNYSAHIWAGYSFIEAQRFDQAATAFQHATSLQPQDYDANFWRGISLLRGLHFQSAIPNLEQALKSKPGDREVRKFLLGCYLATGQTKKILSLHLGVFISVSIIMVAFYVPLAALLLGRSVRTGLRPEPGFGYTSAWWGVTMLGQSVLTIAPIALFSWSPGQVVGVSLIVPALPLIIAALVGFSRQPWGGPFMWPRCALDWKVLLSSFFVVLAAMAVCWGYTSLVEQISGKPMPRQIMARWLGSDIGKWPWSVFLGVALAAPITEEILFRGLLYGAFKKRLSTIWTIIWTAALFALVHLQPIYFAPIFALGLALGWVRNKSEGLWLPVMMHSLINAVALLIALRH
jgi:membrane protease YdiL (CAAX protease family)/tetratricopeptide (TPR) repeat protein